MFFYFISVGEMVIVDNIKGYNYGYCGTSVRPCKSLALAVYFAKDNATIFIKGTIEVYHMVYIHKSLRITGSNATIIGYPSPHFYAFATTPKAKLTIKGLRIKNTNVVLVYRHSSINIEDCLVVRSPSAVVAVWDFSDASIYFSNSRLQDVGYVIYHREDERNRFRGTSRSNINIQLCNIENTRGFFLGSYSHDLHVIFNSTNIINMSKCDGLAVQRQAATLAGTVWIINSSIISSRRHACGLSTVYFVNQSSIYINSSVFRGLSSIVVSIAENVTINSSMFNYNTNRSLIVEVADFVTITSCSFSHNIARRYENEKRFALETVSLRMVDTLNITKCTFFNNTSDFAPALNIVRTNSTIISSSIFTDLHAEYQAASIHIKNSGQVQINTCQFFNSTSLGGGAVFSTLTHSIEIQGCFFQNLSSVSVFYGGAIYINASESAIIERSIFVHCKAREGHGGAIALSNVTHTRIENCIFDSNEAKTGGAIYSINFLENTRVTNETRVTGIAHVAGCIKRSILHIHHTSFVNNYASSAAASLYSSTDVYLRNVTSKSSGNVDAIRNEGGGVKMANVEVELTDSKAPTASLVKPGFTITTGYILVVGLLRFICPKHYIVSVKNSSVSFFSTVGPKRMVTYTTYTMLLLNCETCPAGGYTLSHGEANILSMDNNASLFNPSCLKCPLGGICEGTIRAVDNFWGFSAGASAGEDVSFVSCPAAYCCFSRKTPCTSFNTCERGRSGTLCGACAPGFKQSFVTSGCIEDDETCTLASFVLYVFLYGLACTIFFSYMGNIKIIGRKLLRFLRRFCCCCNRQSDEQFQQHVPTGEDFPYVSAILILIFYYQISSLLHIPFNSGKNDDGFFVRARNVLSNLFNFRFSVYKNICPANDMNLIEKHFINMGIKVLCITNLYIFLLLWKAYKLILPMLTKTLEEDPEAHRNDANEDGKPKLLFSGKLKVCFIRFLKLFFAPTASFAFTMIHCIEILGKNHLYVFGDHVCYEWWQYVIAVVILPAVIIFPVTFDISLYLLKDGRISTNAFLVAAAIPYCAIYLHVKTRRLNVENDVRRAEAETACISEIIEVEEGK